MATFVQTTLTKRTGATTTVFDPSVIDKGGWAHLSESSAYAGLGADIAIQTGNTGNGRKTQLQVSIPQVTVDSDGLPTVRGTIRAKFDLYVPNSSDSSDVDDIVGYLKDLFTSATTNFDDILVNGVGVY